MNDQNSNENAYFQIIKTSEGLGEVDVDRIRAELSDLITDAERYRWLRENITEVFACQPEDRTSEALYWGCDVDDPDSLDSRIDEARSRFPRTSNPNFLTANKSHMKINPSDTGSFNSGSTEESLSDQDNLKATTPAPLIKTAETFQSRVHDWATACFGAEIASYKPERNNRFIEESLELVQSLGMSKADVLALVDYVYSRPAGNPEQEVGGVMTTLSTLCSANGVDMHIAAENELERIWPLVEKIRAKHASKPRNSPLPGSYPVSTSQPSIPVEAPKPSSSHSDESVRDAVAEAIRLQFVKLPRYSFLLDNKGNVRRVPDKSGNWVEFYIAHTLFDPVCVDDALSHADKAVSVQAVPPTEDQIDSLRGLDTPRRIRFYEHEFYVLSNFSAFSLNGDYNPMTRGIVFPTSEHAYHWWKFHGNDNRIADEIVAAPSAHAAFKIAERNKTRRRLDWDDVKVGIMRDILRAKAAQHKYVRRKLLETGNRQLIEDSWRDDFWGWGPNRYGKNMLGILWMEVRAELQSQSDTSGDTNDL